MFAQAHYYYRWSVDVGVFTPSLFLRVEMVSTARWMATLNEWNYISISKNCCCYSSVLLHENINQFGYFVHQIPCAWLLLSDGLVLSVCCAVRCLVDDVGQCECIKTLLNISSLVPNQYRTFADTTKSSHIEMNKWNSKYDWTREHVDW